MASRKDEQQFQAGLQRLSTGLVLIAAAASAIQSVQGQMQTTLESAQAKVQNAENARLAMQQTLSDAAARQEAAPLDAQTQLSVSPSSIVEEADLTDELAQLDALAGQSEQIAEALKALTAIKEDVTAAVPGASEAAAEAAAQVEASMPIPAVQPLPAPPPAPLADGDTDPVTGEYVPPTVSSPVPSEILSPSDALPATTAPEMVESYGDTAAPAPDDDGSMQAFTPDADYPAPDGEKSAPAEPGPAAVTPSGIDANDSMGVNTSDPAMVDSAAAYNPDANRPAPMDAPPENSPAADNTAYNPASEQAGTVSDPGPYSGPYESPAPGETFTPVNDPPPADVASNAVAPGAAAPAPSSDTPPSNEFNG